MTLQILLAGMGGRCFRLLMNLQILVDAVAFENLIIIKGRDDTFQLRLRIKCSVLTKMKEWSSNTE